MNIKLKMQKGENRTLKEEIFDEAIYNYKRFKKICVIETIIIIGLVLVIILKGA